MSKKAFVPTRPAMPRSKPVRVDPKPPAAQAEKVPRNIIVMIAVPALIVALLGVLYVFWKSGIRNITTGLFPMMGMVAMGALLFSGRLGRGRKISWGELESTRRAYLRELDVDRDEIQKAVCAERKKQEIVHSKPRALGSLIGGPRMWERSRSDADFLDVRLGLGVQHAPDSVLTVKWPDIPYDEELECVTGGALRDFILEQTKIRDIAKVLSLPAEPGYSFVGEDLDQVRALMRSVLCGLAVFHNPKDVKLMVVTRNPELWSWMVWLPHNLHDELFDACGWRRLVFASPQELEATLDSEIAVRDQRLGPWKRPQPLAPSTTPSAMEQASSGGTAAGDVHSAAVGSVGPHWVIIDDNTGSPEAWEGVIGQIGKVGTTVLRVASRVGVGVGFGKEQVFEVVSRPAARKHSGKDNGRGVVIDQAGNDVGVSPILRLGGKFYAHADQLTIPRAYRYARVMARWYPTSASRGADSKTGSAELLRSMGITDARELDVERLWRDRRGRGDEQWCEIPVGTKPNGELQNIIFRAKDFGGMGFHSVVIGTSGSGKSEFFLSEAIGIALTHSPETFNIIFVDMKFDSAAQDILGLPHVAAALSNMGKDERHLAERMRKTIQGEIKRRYELFATVGARDANDYEEIRLAGRDLEPVPVLLVVIDEYLELFNSYPEWIDLIIHIAQVGRGANVFFQLGGQRQDLTSLQKVSHSIAFKIALRAESGDESREVIGSDAAFHLPSKENGHALLKVGPRDLEPFRCFYLSAPFVKPKVKKVTKTVDMTLTEPRLYTWEHQPLDESDRLALAAAAEAEEEPDEFLYHPDGVMKKKLVHVIRETLAQVPHRAPRDLWLPPLETPERVDALVAAYRGKPWYEDYGRNTGLVWPLAVIDIPEESKQQVHSVDALRSNIAVVGTKQRGKTTTLMTLMTSAALMYSPARLSFFCIGGSALEQVSSLPHVAGIVGSSDTEGIVRTLSTLEKLISSREGAFRAAKIDIDEFRERRFGPGATGQGTDPADRYGDVFLVVDDFSDLYASDSTIGDRIVALSSVGLEYGVHVIISASGWIHGQRQNLFQNANVKIQLRLADPTENKMGEGSLEARKAAKRTLNLPGFGLSESLHEMLIGLPQIAVNGQAVSTRDVGAQVAAVAGVDIQDRGLRRLPARIELKTILEQQDQTAAPWSFAFSIGEQHDLGPVPLLLTESPGLAIYGRQGCGKSTTLAAIGEAIMSRFSPEQAQLTIIDPKTGLQNLDRPGYVHGYAYDQDEIDELLTSLARDVLIPRLPPRGLSQEQLRTLKPWQGPRHFVLIDDVQDLRPAVSYPPPAKDPVGSALWKLMENARRIGLHVFTTRNSQNFAQLEMDPWTRFQRAAKVSMLFMDNDPQNKISQKVRAQALPPGRGLLLSSDSAIEGVLVGMPETDVSNRVL